MRSRKNTPITRRTVLRGLGATIALPWLESMSHLGSAWADTTRAARATAGGMPLRMAFLFVPNGVNLDHWRVHEEGPLTTLPRTLEPLAPFKSDLIYFTGLAQNNARPLGDGPGDHARSLATFLTGVHPKKTDGADIRAGISVDQVAAQKLGRLTRFPSLELGIERGAQSGGCDSGYSCAYSSNISWSSPTTPVAKEIDPAAVFDRLFGRGGEAELKRRQHGASILDFVNDEARRLKPRLAVADQRKLDEYLQSIREIEVRIKRGDDVPKPPKDFQKPHGKPDDTAEHIRLMFDLLAIAFQGDLTRIATFMFANEGSNKTYPAVGVNDGHHELSHHGKSPEKLEKIAKIDRFHIEGFAYLLNRLKQIKEGERSLLDNCMIVYGSGISDGDRHNHDDLPVLFAGRGGGTFRTGRHVKYPNDTPMTNLYLSMLERFGTPVDSLGDSTGTLPNLS